KATWTRRNKCQSGCTPKQCESTCIVQLQSMSKKDLQKSYWLQKESLVSFAFPSYQNFGTSPFELFISQNIFCNSVNSVFTRKLQIAIMCLRRRTPSDKHHSQLDAEAERTGARF